MAEQCSIGKEYQNNIQKLEYRIKEIELDMVHLKKNAVNADSVHKLEIKITELNLKFEEMQNNHIENRKTMELMRGSIDAINSRLAEYVEGNFKILSNQEISSNEQASIKEDISDLKKMIKDLAVEIDANNIWNQIKALSEKSKVHKWFLRILFLTIVMMFLASASFIFGGGLTLPDIINFLKGVIM